jgi:hypothetical protein
VSDDRDISAHPAATPAELAPGRRWIAVIGIDRYGDRQWRSLRNAVEDARGTSEAFRSVGFELVAPPLFDERATGAAIHALVTDGLRALSRDDSLVVFFAGHGSTQSHDIGASPVTTGYLIPADGEHDRLGSWIEADMWLRRIAKLPPRHILVILDACFSGSALQSVRWGRNDGRLPALPFATSNAKLSRIVITSSMEDEAALDNGPVPGHSLFTGCLLEALSGGVPGASHGGRRVATGTDLGVYVRHRVQTYPGAPGWQQTPDFGTFDFDQRGEMLIPLPDDGEPPRLAAGSRELLAARATSGIHPVATIAVPVATSTATVQAALAGLSEAPVAPSTATVQADPAALAGPPEAAVAPSAAAVGSAPAAALAARPMVTVASSTGAVGSAPAAPADVGQRARRRRTLLAAIAAVSLAALGVAAYTSLRGSPRSTPPVAAIDLIADRAGKPDASVAAAVPAPVSHAAIETAIDAGAGMQPTAAIDAGVVMPPAHVAPGPAAQRSTPMTPARSRVGAIAPPPLPVSSPDAMTTASGKLRQRVTVIPSDQKLAPGVCGAYVTSRPRDADILRDGELVGRTPTRLELPCDLTVSLTLRKAGYKDAPRKVTGLSTPGTIEFHLSKLTATND